MERSLGRVSGSWRWTFLAMGLVAVVVVAAMVVATRWVDLQHANLPGHPYPPSGYVVNPLASDPNDLLPSATVAKVKADMQRDGAIEDQAIRTGDGSALSQAAIGRGLQGAQQLMARNEAAGVVEREDVGDYKLVVGRLPDPNDPRLQWCVQYSGKSTLTFTAKSTGKVLSTQAISFSYHYWLQRVGDRYLLADEAFA